jgi:Cdc6-like AAA superfamily ATPase
MSSRPKARRVHWSLLDEAQVKGFHGALHALVEVAQRLEARQGPPRSDDPSRWLSPDRSNHIVFISGTRGTGKTTVLTSLISALTASSQTDPGSPPLERS